MIYCEGTQGGMQSFAKNAGLYGERIGALHIVSADRGAADRVKSQLSVLQRSEISNPPMHGARLVTLLLTDAELLEDWKGDVRTMANRIIEMRKALYGLLKELGTPGQWEHIVQQIGMFSFTGLGPAACVAMVERGHVYMTGNGRISMAGLNSRNVRYVAECIDQAVRGSL
jgi:aspartate aminotransferase